MMREIIRQVEVGIGLGCRMTKELQNRHISYKRGRCYMTLVRKVYCRKGEKGKEKINPMHGAGKKKWPCFFPRKWADEVGYEHGCD